MEYANKEPVHPLRTSDQPGPSIGPSTSGPSGGGYRFTYEEWISKIFEKNLGDVTHQYNIKIILQNPAHFSRSHNPPAGIAAFSEAIMGIDALVPLHSFVEEVLDYFNLDLFQLTLNFFKARTKFPARVMMLGK